MSQPIHEQIIKEARTLIADEKNWCRRQMAYDRDGMAVCATDRKAAKFGSYGAVIAAAHRLMDNSKLADALAGSAVSYLGGSSTLIKVNDRIGHGAVLALFDEAITGRR
jgi:hypothetical protein